jgi:Xaa-Pro aminopeptidase
MLLPLLAAAGFAHPNPQPPSELPAAVYRDRRERVMKEIGGCATAIAAQGEPTGVVQEYRQDDDFFWLTGINEPGGWLILMPKAKYRRHVLFLRPRDPEAERWTGPRAPLSPSLKAQYAVDEVRRGNGGKWLLGSAPAHDCLAVVAPAEDLKDERTDVQALKQAAGALGLKLVYKRDLLARMRSAHASEEIALLERAVAITRAGHEAAARATVRRFGHFVGLNVHDAGEYDLPIPAGAVFTVEPGIYLPERGFGVRIEDEVLFLGNGKWRLLTADFPRKLEDVEAWVARARR